MNGPYPAHARLPHLGITARLYLAMFLLSMAAVVAAAAASWLSFNRNFIGYLNQQDAERMTAMLPRLQEAWREHGSWDYLHDNRKAWFELMRPPRPDNTEPGAAADAAARDESSAGRDSEAEHWRSPPNSELVGVLFRARLLDAHRNIVAGNRQALNDDIQLPVVVDGRTVGWLAVLPFREVTAAADLQFQAGQRRAVLLIAAVAALVAAVVAGALARAMLAPLRRIADAAGQLAAGRYETRVAVPSRDEIGQLAEDFNQLAFALQRTEESRRAFMADISHELRTPLTVLAGELEALEDGVRHFSPASLKSLQAEAAALGKLVRDLSDLSLTDAGALSYRREPVDLVGILGEALEPFAARLRDRGIVLDLQLPSAPVLVLGDEGRLRQLFRNLAENSLRYTDAGGLLRVRCAVEGSVVPVVFEDSAPGVPAPLLPRLFERFFRVDASRNRSSGGSGLGLAICRNIVEAHGGRIEAFAAALGGLGVRVELPLHT